MRGLERLVDGVADGVLSPIGRFFGIRSRILRGPEEGMTEFIEGADPQHSIKVVCGHDELPRVLAEIAKGAQHLEAKKK